MMVGDRDGVLSVRKRLGVLVRDARADRGLFDTTHAAGVSPETLRKIDMRTGSCLAQQPAGSGDLAALGDCPRRWRTRRCRSSIHSTAVARGAVHSLSVGHRGCRWRLL